MTECNHTDTQFAVETIEHEDVKYIAMQGRCGKCMERIEFKSTFMGPHPMTVGVSLDKYTIFMPFGFEDDNDKINEGTIQRQT